MARGTIELTEKEMDEIPDTGVNEKEQVYPTPSQGTRFIQQFFDRKVEDVLNLYETTAPVSHGGEKGTFRELLLRGILASIIPPHFGLGTGLIVDSRGRQSRQTDIIIFDRRVLPPVVFHEGHGLYPIDAVLRTIEVKSTLSGEDLQKAEDAALLLHPDNPDGLKIVNLGILPGGKSYYPFSALFAFEADWNITTDSLPAGMKKESAACKIVCVAKRNFCSVSGVQSNASSAAHALRLFACALLEKVEESAESRSKFALVEWLAGE